MKETAVGNIAEMWQSLDSSSQSQNLKPLSTTMYTTPWRKGGVQRVKYPNADEQIMENPLRK